jgi:hypothetical protein
VDEEGTVYERGQAGLIFLLVALAVLGLVTLVDVFRSFLR